MFMTFLLHNKSKRNPIMVIHVACNCLICCTTSGLHSIILPTQQFLCISQYVHFTVVHIICTNNTCKLVIEF